MDKREILFENVWRIRERIDNVARRAGRSDTVRLIAVSKYVQVDDGLIDLLLESGCRDFGEARPQLLLEKMEHFAGRNEPIQWHMIGPLQRNKIRKLLPAVSLIHSVESVRLLDAMNRIAIEESLSPVPVLLEINISGDENKHGFVPGDFPQVFDEMAIMTHVQIRGFMCMSGLESDVSTAREEFSQVRKLRDTMQPHAPDNCNLQELSMGMSDDFEIAIEEGATMVRIGSLLFDGIL